MRVRDSAIRFEASQRAFFCLNLGAAFALTFLFYWLGAYGGYPHGTLRPPSSVVESVFNAIFLNRLPWNPIGSTVALLSLTLLVAVLLWALLRVIRSRDAIHLILTFGGGIAALGAIPLCWAANSPGLGGLTFNPTHWYLAVLEFSILGGALYLFRGVHFAIWLLVVLAHYAVWGWFLQELADSQHGSVILGWPPIYLSLVAPCAGLAWAFYVRLGNSDGG